MDFPDLLKDPADSVVYVMDWTSRLAALVAGGAAPSGVKIASAAISVNGDVTVADKTAYPSAGPLSLLVGGGSSFGWTGDPQIATLAVVTVAVTLDDPNAMILSRSFNVIERQL